MKILVAGSSGLIGSALVPYLRLEGHDVRRLVRKKIGDSSAHIVWNPTEGRLDPKDLEGFDAIINLAGENIADSRWTEAKKKRIRGSRINSTRLIAETIAKMEKPPKILINASAVGFYGSQGDALATEESGPGEGFLAETCYDWERATAPAAEAGVRVVNLRIGVVLSAKGGALKKMLLPFKLCLGGAIGDGSQYMSWIAIDDLIRVIHHTLVHPSLQGPVNAVAPFPVTNSEFTKALGKALSRPALLPMPAFAARLAFGEMADALLLSSTKTLPERVRGSGYRFLFPRIDDALTHLLG